MRMPSVRGYVSRAAAVTALALAATAGPHAADPDARLGPPQGAASRPAQAAPAAASRNGKQALLAGQWRPGTESTVLGTRPTRGRPVPAAPVFLLVPRRPVVQCAAARSAAA